MSTPLADSINALTAYANETTGASDTTLSDAVGRLCEGYGGGGELHPVGTDLVTAYLGRTRDGLGNFVLGTCDAKTGEMTADVDNPEYGLCMTFLPIDPNYTYAKNNTGRLYHTFFYDKNKSYITGSDFVYNYLSWMTIPIPQNAKYMRFATHYANSNWFMAIIRTA